MILCVYLVTAVFEPDYGDSLTMEFREEGQAGRMCSVFL